MTEFSFWCKLLLYAWNCLRYACDNSTSLRNKAVLSDLKTVWHQCLQKSSALMILDVLLDIPGRLKSGPVA